MKNKLLVGLIIIILVIISIIFIKNPFNYNLKKNNNINTKESINIDNNDNSKDAKEDIIGKWNTISAVNSIDGTKTENLKDVFGSSYQQYGSYLELKSDKTFIDAIEPITNGSKSNTGSYTIEKDYNIIGDLYVFLNYSDGNTQKLKRVFLNDSNTPYLVLDNYINDYQLTLKK